MKFDKENDSGRDIGQHFLLLIFVLVIVLLVKCDGRYQAENARFSHEEYMEKIKRGGQ
jgi:hypothetical protein